MATENQKNDKKLYRFRNKQFCVWLDGDLNTWFHYFLNKYSYGNSLSEKFRVFLSKA